MSRTFQRHGGWLRSIYCTSIGVQVSSGSGPTLGGQLSTAACHLNADIENVRSRYAIPRRRCRLWVIWRSFEETAQLPLFTFMRSFMLGAQLMRTTVADFGFWD